MVNNWLNIIQDCVLPPTCILCDNRSFSQKDICLPCLNQLIENNHCCYQCGNPVAETSQAETVCEQCLKTPPTYDYTVAPFAYQGIIRNLVTRLKFNDNYKNARLLGTLLAERLQQQAQLPECIIPVPLHEHRYRERGFNQSIEIARTVARQLRIPLELNAFVRHRNTPHQVSLPAKQRHTNIRDAFSVIKPLHYSHVAVLDDVMTTGSTVAEIASVLKKSGVQKVEVWACARAY